MEELKTKTIKKGHLRTELIILAVTFVFQALFTGFLAFAGDLTPKSIITLTNAEREKSGLKALIENKALSKAAELKAADMLKNDYFAHNSPKGATPWHWMKEAGYKYQYAGENLAINFDTAGAEHKAWMKSKTHRENILNARYQEIGVAVAEGKIDGKSTMITVQLFGTPLTAAAKKPEPVPVAMETVPATEVKGVESEASPIVTSDAGVSAAPKTSESYSIVTVLKDVLTLHKNLWTNILWIAVTFVLLTTIVLAPILVIHQAGKELLERYKEKRDSLAETPA